MKQLLLLSVLLLGVAWVAAQDTSNSGQSPSSSSGSSQAGSSQSGSATSGQTGGEASSDKMSGGSHHAVEGCLSGSDGKYTLTDKQGTTYQLTGDTSKLAEHVGHEVKINGSASSGSAGSSASAGGSQTLEVKSVKHISKTCQSGGMGK